MKGYVSSCSVQNLRPWDRWLDYVGLRTSKFLTIGGIFLAWIGACHVGKVFLADIFFVLTQPRAAQLRIISWLLFCNASTPQLNKIVDATSLPPLYHYGKISKYHVIAIFIYH
jgi:hypothetical protein